MDSTTGQSPSVRREVLFSGNVQGVGFRYTTCQVAADYPVGGFVRNLPDGRVQVIVEGPSSAVEQFIRRLTTRMDRYIARAESSEAPARGEFDQFGVRF